MSQQPYVSRPEAEDFPAALDAALKSPKDDSPILKITILERTSQTRAFHPGVKELTNAQNSV